MTKLEAFYELGHEWEVYDLISDLFVENEVTNGDIIFVTAILLAELVKHEGFDFEELIKDIKEMTLANIKIMSDA
jgi:hypothetical protein